MFAFYLRLPVGVLLLALSQHVDGPPWHELGHHVGGHQPDQAGDEEGVQAEASQGQGQH